jgi:hypothetical protein
MSDPTGPAPLPPDDLVQQTVNRAADKVAIAAATSPATPALLNRGESMVVIAVLIVLLLANLYMNLEARSDMRQHQEDSRVVCQLLLERTPAEDARALATQLAQCLK